VKKFAAVVAVIAAAALLSGCVAAQPSSAKPTDSAASNLVAIPRVHDLSVSAAKTTLGEAGLTVTVKPKSQSAQKTSSCLSADSTDPAAGSKVEKGSRVALYEVPATVITMAAESGKTYQSAQADLGTLCLKAAASDPSVGATWNVTGQSVPPGHTVKVGTTITLTVAAPVITYSVTGNGTDSSLITWTVPGTSNTEQATDASLPWSKSFPDVNGSGTISAHVHDGTSISCSITDDGVVVDQQTATGANAIVQCSRR
jgi:beta-lactam-binding protein with PASTA domain